MKKASGMWRLIKSLQRNTCKGGAVRCQYTRPHALECESLSVSRDSSLLRLHD